MTQSKSGGGVAPGLRKHHELVESSGPRGAMLHCKLSDLGGLEMADPCWYYVEAGESVGPVDEAALRQRVRDGLLRRNSLVWREGMREWIQAGDVPGLLPPAVPEPTSSPAPDHQPEDPPDSSEMTHPEPPQREATVVPDPLPANTAVTAGAPADTADVDPTTPVAPSSSSSADNGFSYAGFWKRLAALVIDYTIVFVSMFVLFLGLGILVAILNGTDTYSADDWESMVNCFSFIAFWMYFAGMESSRYQGTLGKVMLRIKVTDLSGQPISFGRACGRHFSKIISGILLGIGYLMAAFTQKKQALHDMIAGCLVVEK